MSQERNEPKSPHGAPQPVSRGPRPSGVMTGAVPYDPELRAEAKAYWEAVSAWEANPVGPKPEPPKRLVDAEVAQKRSANEKVRGAMTEPERDETTANRKSVGSRWAEDPSTTPPPPRELLPSFTAPAPEPDKPSYVPDQAAYLPPRTRWLWWVPVLFLALGAIGVAVLMTGDADVPPRPASPTTTAAPPSLPAPPAALTAPAPAPEATATPTTSGTTPSVSETASQPLPPPAATPPSVPPTTTNKPAATPTAKPKPNRPPEDGLGPPVF